MCQASLANYDVQIDEALTGRGAIAAPLSVACKAAVSTEKNETSVTDRSHPYPDCRCCYCIQVLPTAPSCSDQEKTSPKKIKTAYM